MEYVSSCDKYFPQPDEYPTLPNGEPNPACETYTIPFVRPSEYCPECAKHLPLEPRGITEEIRTYTYAAEPDVELTRAHVFKSPNGPVASFAYDYQAASPQTNAYGPNIYDAILNAEGTKPALLRSRGALTLFWEPGSCFTNDEVDAIVAEFAAIVSRYR